MIDTGKTTSYTQLMDPASIRRLRAHLDMTQVDFGKMVGVTRISVHHWERGTKRPTGSAQVLLRKIADETYGPLVSE